MNAAQAETISARPRCRGQDVECPRCGSVMVEADRVIENAFLYIWYECSTAGCSEQWLTKRPAQAG